MIDWTARVAGATKVDRSPQGKPTQCQQLVPGVDTRQTKRRRNPAVMPVPIPLDAAIEKGNFGYDPETDKPVHPQSAEVRAITENHAERMIELLAQLRSVRASDYRKKDLLNGEYRSKLAMYAEDFGDEAAARLDAYVRHQAEGMKKGSSFFL